MNFRTSGEFSHSLGPKRLTAISGNWSAIAGVSRRDADMAKPAWMTLSGHSTRIRHGIAHRSINR